MQAGTAEVTLGKRGQTTYPVLRARYRINVGTASSVVLVPFREPAPFDYHAYAA